MKTIKKQTLADHIYLALRKDIISKTLIGGTLLQYKELQVQFNVSSSPIREAMNRLYQEGLVLFTSNKSATVIDFSEKDIYEVYHLMRDLEILALKYVIEKDNIDQLVSDLNENISTSKAFHADKDLISFKKSTDAFHIMIYDYCSNKRLLNLVEQIRGQFSILNSSFENNLSNGINILAYHDDILKLLETKNIEEISLVIHEYFDRMLNLGLTSLK